MSAATIVWFRQDLRLQDNPALAAAVARGESVVPVFIWDEAGEGDWTPGGASRWWLHHSLVALEASLRERGLKLIIRRGTANMVLRELINSTRASAVFWNRRYEPAAIACDEGLTATLGVEVKTFNAALLFEPHTVQNKAGGPFQVFTPYWRHCLTLPVAEPASLRTGAWRAPARWPASLPLAELGLLPETRWDSGL